MLYLSGMLGSESLHSVLDASYFSTLPGARASHVLVDRYSATAASTVVLSCDVYDKDLFSDDFIGGGVVDLKESVGRSVINKLITVALVNKKLKKPAGVLTIVFDGALVDVVM